MPNPDITHIAATCYYYDQQKNNVDPATVTCWMQACFHLGTLDTGSGTSAAQGQPVQKATQQTASDNNARYVMGHLLNNWLGGVADNTNLFPFSARLNGHHLHAVEEDVKEAVTGKRQRLGYGAASIAEDYIYQVQINPLVPSYGTPSAINAVNTQQAANAATYLAQVNQWANTVGVTLSCCFGDPTTGLKTVLVT